MNDQNQDQNQLLYRIALTLVNGVGCMTAKHLLQTIGDAESIFKEKKQVLKSISGIQNRIIQSIKDPEVLLRAEKEVAFIEANKIRTYCILDSDYPHRLKECPDSPVILYYKGNASLNNQKTLSVVGTRHAGEYGRRMTEEILRDLAVVYPDLLIVSGLAYGIDIAAHKAALKENLPTIAVLAHGLDRIYPAQHRNIAVNMLDNGGLLTDFISGTNPDRQNFVMRNRIVAGISDCTLVVESARKGGALITAEIALSYGRDVMAVPGKSSDLYSQGCNKLIKENKAALVENAEDILHALCWEQKQKGNNIPVQQELFEELTENEQKVYDILQKEEMQVNMLSVQTNLPIHQLSPLLFEMEMKGILKCLPGGIYRRTSSLK